MNKAFENILERLEADEKHTFDGCINKRYAKKIVQEVSEEYNGGWIPVSSGKFPKTEEEVFILTDKGTMTTAMYEDGTMLEGDSAWRWYDYEFEYDEDADDYIIPEGWWEYRHFNPDDVYNNAVDEEVIAWQPLPERFKERD